MKFFRVILCLALFIFSCSLLGCRGGNASKVFTFMKREAKQEIVQQAAEYAYKEAAGNNSSIKSPPKSESPNTTRPASGMKSTVAKAGVAALAGAAVANEAKAYSQNVSQARKVLVGYYMAIADRRMREAYNSLTWEVQNQLGTFENYSNGYGTTVSNEVTNIEVLSEGDNNVRLSYQLTSKDNINGTIKVQMFLGKADLIKSDGRWLISNFDVKVK